MSFTKEELALRRKLYVCWESRVWNDTQVACAGCGKPDDICRMESWKPENDAKAYFLCDVCMDEQYDAAERGMTNAEWLAHKKQQAQDAESPYFSAKVTCHVCHGTARLREMEVLKLTESKEPDIALLQCPKCEGWIEANREPLDLVMADNKCSQDEAIRMWKVENSVTFTWTAG